MLLNKMMFGIVIFAIYSMSALAIADVQIGNIKIKDDGRIVFPDSSEQSSATQQGPQGPAGPVGAQGATGQAGPQGPACSPLGVTCAVGELYVQTASGILCGRLKPISNAIGVCVGTNCTLSCPDNYNDCDSSLYNGCESSRLSDNNNCGGCGIVCQNGATCDSGICVNPPSLQVTAKLDGSTLLVDYETIHVPSFPIRVHFSLNVSDAMIYYTTDGTTPTTSSQIVPLFTGDIWIGTNSTLKYFAKTLYNDTTVIQTHIIQSP